MLLGAWADGFERDKYGNPVIHWVPCMVISYLPDVRRRHSKKTAPVDGWEVLVFWFAEGRSPLEQVRISNNGLGWRLAGW